MQNEYGSKGLKVVGVTQADEAAAARFVNETSANYAVYSGASDAFSNWGVSALPATYLVSPAGTVVAQGLGEIRAALEEELGS